MSYDFESTNDDLRTSSSSDSSLTARYVEGIFLHAYCILHVSLRVTFNVSNKCLTNRYYRIQKVVQSYGDIEKIYNGLFSNYLSMNYRDNMELVRFLCRL